jgi:3-keto-5-aminohexanoate cleavage enzyme
LSGPRRATAAPLCALLSTPFSSRTSSLATRHCPHHRSPNMDQPRTWLEVSLNGPWGRGKQPRIPVSVDEIVADGVACVRAGAAIVHVHAYDEATGKPSEDHDVYARIITGIRSVCDAIVYPTIPAPGLSSMPQDAPASDRFATVESLAKRGMLEWAAVDPGSVNIASYDDLREDREGAVYLNPEDHIRHALGLARRHRFHPACAIYEPGFLRLGATLHWRCSSPAPVYRFMFSSGYTFSFPPEDYALTAYLNLMDQVAPGAQWMIGGLSVDVLPMIPRVVAEGGHVRVGLEDAPFGSQRSNVEWVEAAARSIANCGGELATAEEVRATLAAVEMGEG